MRRSRRLTLCCSLLAALAAAGCGGGGGRGKATLWITRDRGARVMLVRTVDAGQTALQALDRETDVETRYGGRFVDSIDGLAGDLGRRRDWFYFVNGIEADRSAAEYRLHPGDVEWWDYRSWVGRMREPVVVGAFPEPFLHGFDGRPRPAAVVYAPGRRRGAMAIARVIGARWVKPAPAEPPRASNVFRLVRGRPRLVARPRGGASGDPVEFEYAGSAQRLARDPSFVHRRYRWP